MDLTILPESELRSLAARIDALLRTRRSESSDDQLLFGVIASQLDRRGHVWNFYAFSKSPLFVQFVHQLTFVRAYVDRFFLPKTRAERLKSYSVLISLLVQFLEQSRVPVSMKTIVVNLDKVARLVDDQFPGYRESGLLPLLLTRQRRI